MLSQAVRIHAALHRARAFHRAEIDPFRSPPDWQSALRKYQERRPPPTPGTVIAVHPSTDGPAVLKRVLSEGDQQRAIEAERKRKWRAARSPEQVSRDRARDRDWRRLRRAGRRAAASAG